MVAPVGAPGVLDEPVLDAVFDSEANDDDSMVDVIGGVLADSGAGDSAGVVTEAINDLESDGDWSVLENSNSESVFVSFGDVDGATDDLESECCRLDSAVLVNGFVWIRNLGADASGGSDVFESVGWETTFATVVVVGSSAIHELLLGQAIELLILE